MGVVTGLEQGSAVIIKLYGTWLFVQTHRESKMLLRLGSLFFRFCDPDNEAEKKE